MGFLNYIFLSLVFVCKIFATDDSDKLWILFDNAQLQECSGVTNQFMINKEDIVITDKNGKAAYYLECPNEYTIEFKNIKPKSALPNLSGDISSTIQVPLIKGPGNLELDFPYQAIPQKHLVGGSTCDNVSGVITDKNEKRDYCRYCDICAASTFVENGINDAQRFNYLQNLKENEKFSSVCKSIDPSKTYNLKRKVNCPSKKELEAEANRNVKPGLDTNLEKKLKVGKGKLQVFLSLISSSTAPVDDDQYYANHKGCECCSKDDKGKTNCKPNFFSQLGSKFTGGAFPGADNPCLKCNTDYVQACISGSSSKAGCFRVEYNFRVTDQRSDVEQFQEQIEYNKKVGKGNPWSSGTGSSAGGAGSLSGSVAGLTPCAQCPKDKCTAAITVSGTKSYCSTWWGTQNAKKFCCSKCPTVCAT